MDRSVNTFPPVALHEWTQQVLEAVSVPSGDADLVADALICADQRGIYSHGLLRLPLYVTALQAGGMNPTPSMAWRCGDGAVAVLDADSALGQVAMGTAVERVAELAGRYGVGCVAVENSTHYGAGNYWTDMLTREGLAAILTSTTGPRVAPFGGREPILGTNPLTISFPSTNAHALTMDMATSEGAYGKVVAAQSEGRAIPLEWAVDAEGQPTTNPGAALTGAFLPFGGHKGSALSVLLEALAASLTHAHFAYETTDIWVDPATKMNTGHVVIALDPQFFTGVAHTRERVESLRGRVRASGTGTKAPGDPEVSRADSEWELVQLNNATCEQLDQLSDRLGLHRPTRRGARSSSSSTTSDAANQ